MAAKPPKIFGIYGYADKSGERNNQVKIATSNLFMEQTTTDVEIMAGAVFDAIGSNEFVNETSYEELQGNTTSSEDGNDVANRNDSSNIIPQVDGQESTLTKYTINLKSHIPDYSAVVSRAKKVDDTGADSGYENVKSPIYWADSNYNKIVIEVEGLAPDEEVEVEFIKYSNLNDGTIV